MNRFLLNSTVAAITLLSASAALADDYNSGVVTKTPGGGYTDVEFGSGWYLRGDITYNIDGKSNTTFANIPQVGRSAQIDYNDAVGVRVGAGYYAAPNLRLEVSTEALFQSEFDSFSSNATFGGVKDITVTDALGASVTGTVTFDSNGNSTGSTVGLANGTAVGAIGGTEDFEASYSATNLLLNAYYDLAKVGSFTPYVGVGAGISRINYNQSRTLQCNASGTETCNIGAAPLTLTLDEEFWTYAYQLSVGTAIAVDDRTSIDLSYSYTGVGNGDDINYSDGTAIDDDGFNVHQIRAGIRYDIW